MTNSNAEYLPPGTNSKITSTKASPPTPLKISEKIEAPDENSKNHCRDQRPVR